MLVRNSKWTKDLLDELAGTAKFLNSKNTVRPFCYVKKHEKMGETQIDQSCVLIAVRLNIFTAKGLSKKGHNIHIKVKLCLHRESDFQRWHQHLRFFMKLQRKIASNVDF